MEGRNELRSSIAFRLFLRHSLIGGIPNDSLRYLL